MYKVILIDDEKWVVIGLKKLIGKTNLPFEVVDEAENGISAYEKVITQKPDILFSDIRMPGLNGLELLKELNRAKSQVKVVFISGYAEFQYAQEAVRLGAFDYLLKPIEQETITAILQRFLSGKEGGFNAVPAGPISDSRVDKVIEEIGQRYRQDVSLGQLSSKYGLSIGYLSSLIKSRLGCSYSEYITKKRIEDAKKLLLEQALSIDEIAEAVGYRDYFYFTKVFKNIVGVSPSKFRKDPPA